MKRETKRQIKSKVKIVNTTTVEIDIFIISNHLGKIRAINHNNSVHNRVEIAEEPIPIQEERPAVPQVAKNAITAAKSDISQNTASLKQSQNNKSTGSILITYHGRQTAGIKPFGIK